MKTAEYAIDTNIVLRFLLQDDRLLSEKANAIFVAIDDGTLNAHLDPVVLGEIVWVLKSFYKLPPETVCDLVLPIVSHGHINIPDKNRYANALQLYQRTRDFGDACACALALEACEGNLLSFDRRIRNVPGIIREEAV